MVWPDPPPGHMGVFHFSPKTPTYIGATGLAEKDLMLSFFFKYIYAAAGGGWMPGGLNHTTIYGLI